MNPQFIIRPEAEADMAEACVWYEDRKAGLGHEFLAEVRQGLRGNLCRCTGYQHIVDAVLDAAMQSGDDA